jgi:aminopeptidase N
MVATNEFEEPWLDEGVNSYSTARIMEAAYGISEQYLRLNLVPLPLPRWLGLAPLDQRQLARLGPIADRGQDRIWRRAWQFRDIFSYFVNSYPKSTSVLWQLQTELGEEVMARVMRAYFQRWQFRHPDSRDFIEVAEGVSGRELDWFFDQLLFGTGTLDYAVTEAESEPLGFEAGVFDGPEGRITRAKEEMEAQRERAEESDDDIGPYRTTVVIENHGTIQYPVDVLVRFTDGSEVQERWDGGYRWVRFSYEREARLDRVIVDPEERLLIDLNRANNSFVAEPLRRADLRWSLKLLMLIQHLLQSLGAVVT